MDDIKNVGRLLTTPTLSMWLHSQLGEFELVFQFSILFKAKL